MPTYTYLRVMCPRCGWRGKRSYSTTWPACPRCHANGSTIKKLESPKPEANTGDEK